MTPTQETKSRAILRNYRNGNRIDARAAIIKLRKKDLAQLLVNPHHVMHLPPTEALQFQDFVLQALDA